MIYNIFFIVLLAVAAICAWRICVADWRRRIIPDAYLFPLLLIGLIITHFFPWPTSPADGVIAAIFGYALAACVGFIFDVRQRHQNKSNVAPAPIGMGDIKLMAAGGVMLGAGGIWLAFCLALLPAGGYSLLLLKKGKGKKAVFALGPFLCAGMAAAWMAGLLERLAR